MPEPVNSAPEPTTAPALPTGSARHPAARSAGARAAGAVTAPAVV